MTSQTRTRAANRLNLAQCIRLQQNNFLLSDDTEVYDHDEVVSHMIKLQSSRDSKKIAQLFRDEAKRNLELSSSLPELPPPIPYEAMADYVEEILF